MKRENKSEKYYVGLDIGTDSVGYAVTSPHYELLKYRGEAMWGATVFEAANLAEERRMHRVERRRLNRKKQRVSLIQELFAPEIAKVDPRFFIRLQESSLYREAGEKRFSLFPTMQEQRAYGKRYPTIHHLLMDLMTSVEPHDVRLLYLACSWLAAHRGHFLSEVNRENVEQVLDFHFVYQNLIAFLKRNMEVLPWSEEIDEQQIGDILKQNIGVTKKYRSLCNLLLRQAKAPKEVDEDHPFSVDGMLRLMCGGKIALKDLFGRDEYADMGSVSLDMEDEILGQICTQIGDDAALLTTLKSVYDWSVLVDVLHGEPNISAAKIRVYELHGKDLAFLKKLLRRYAPQAYEEVFKVQGSQANYARYTGHLSDSERDELKQVCKGKIEKANKVDFSKYLLSVVRKINPEEEDRAEYDDMITRLELQTFLPKQKESDNRVIPYQLYWTELDRILKNAETYLPFLSQPDEDGLTVSDKIRSVFTYRIPYYVGPLCAYKNENAWMVRKSEGRIYPWNFNERVDLDASEQAFIARMTNQCTYLPGEDVLPQNSVCYSAYCVLNEINNIKINDVPISVKAKQEIYTDLFMQMGRVTVKRIRDYLISRGYMAKEDMMTGLDETVKSSMKSYLQFKQLLDRKQLNIQDVERIISRASYSEERARFESWLSREYPDLSSVDQKYVANLKFKDFGRMSKTFLCGFPGVDLEEGTGEARSIMEFLWITNCNLMQLMSDRFTFSERRQEFVNDYYEVHPQTLSDRLDSMYISGAVKRPIIRTLDIVKDIVKVNGHAPQKIFVEMARGASEDQKGKRTKTRYQQLQELYQSIRTEEVRAMNDQLDHMGDRVDNILQNDKVFLYFTQLGKCLYTGHPISLDALRKGDGTYNIEHIYPQSAVKDDSVLHNEILVDSTINGDKSDHYPIAADIQNKMGGYWSYLHDMHLISDEKYKRLIRKTPFANEEKWGFINRQLTETRQSTKAVAALLREMYPDTEIVYVKAGLVSDFRHEFGMVKSRTVNDLHHAKDAYLNIVTGNVYNARFNKQFFRVDEPYSIKTKTVFTNQVRLGKQTVWDGESSLAVVRQIMKKTPRHFTRYAFCRTGALFDLMPFYAGDHLVPRKKNMPAEIYGGYNKATASFFALIKYRIGKKTEIMVTPVELMHSEQFLKDDAFALSYAEKTVSSIVNKEVSQVEILLSKRILKVNTVLSLDGFRACISGKSGGGKQLGLTPMVIFSCGAEKEAYIKKLESFANKQQKNSKIQVDSHYDGITKEKNAELYDFYVDKFTKWPYSNRPNNPIETLRKGQEKFNQLTENQQVGILLGIQGLFGRGIKADLSEIGGSVSTGVATLSPFISNWKKKYKDVRIVDSSASGLYETTSENLLDML